MNKFSYAYFYVAQFEILNENFKSFANVLQYSGFPKIRKKSFFCKKNIPPFLNRKFFPEIIFMNNTTPYKQSNNFDRKKLLRYFNQIICHQINKNSTVSDVLKFVKHKTMRSQIKLLTLKCSPRESQAKSTSWKESCYFIKFHILDQRNNPKRFSSSGLIIMSE